MSMEASDENGPNRTLFHMENPMPFLVHYHRAPLLSVAPYISASFLKRGPQSVR